MSVGKYGNMQRLHGTGEGPLRGARFCGSVIAGAYFKINSRKGAIKKSAEKSVGFAADARIIGESKIGRS